MSSECKFCNQSAGFYQKLVAENAKHKKLKIVAGFSENVETARSYLKQYEINADDILQVKPSEIGVRGTPTIVLVDNTGTVENIWFGKLPSGKEAEILEFLKANV